MTELSRSDFQKLAQTTGSTCISIYMPAEKAGTETRKNPIRFKNLIREAEQKIEQLNKSEELAKSLKSAEGYVDNYDFWQHQDCGLAFFIDAERVQYYRLPYSFQSEVEVSDRFYLKPLLPVISNDSKFYLLSLSQNQVKFFLGSHYSINQIQLPESAPASLAEALKYDDPEKQTQSHSANSGNSPIYHGQGVGTTDNKDEIKRFFDQVDNSLKAALQSENTPLILAGVDYLLPIYHEANSYNNLLEAGITGNPENVATEDLHRSAWEIIEPHFAAQRQQAMDKYHQLADTNEASSQLEQIIPSAANGQVETLFIAADAQKWGQFQPQANKVIFQTESAEDSIDLINFAVVQTFLQGGNVYIQKDMPADTDALAVFRYPVYAKANA